jgi:ferritin-like metal-binding protein YciE
MRHPKNVTDVLVLEIVDLHNAETQLRLALPSMRKAAACVGLRDLINGYKQNQDDNNLQLEEIAEMLGGDAHSGFCPCMAEFIDEYGIKQDIPNGVVRDASLICVLQKISHYKLALYGSTHELARLLGLAEACGVLAALLRKETVMNNRINQLAHGHTRPAGMIPLQTFSVSL